MTLAVFLKECKVNPGSYYGFMNLKGADNGCANNLYYGASLFFYRRERRALSNVSANSLRSFMNLKRGAGSGAANVAYRKSYVFFEKKRRDN
ncbi:hypothetical protein KRP22_006535 [Phytophthora ramorum]|uniref:uncharacterized protein n=1 Tax=Phytophthora ramorum TaxID=164328 RepID=UPI00309A35C2|nr:hypothetical protein KRP23_4438 [Phytophthora ramorum]KAH7507232.1 hypothetical protein KRP22_2335 [Phytophthora ramorum]